MELKLFGEIYLYDWISISEFLGEIYKETEF